MASKPSNFEPTAPPLIDQELQYHHENQPLSHGQGHAYDSSASSYHPIAYGQLPPSYQQYMAPSPSPPAYGIPVWQQQQQQEARDEWSTGLCHCTADVSICLLGCLCPCFLFGKVAEKLDDGMISCLAPAIIWYIVQQFTSLGCIYSCGYRRKLRARYHLPAKPLPDCLVHWICWPCAFCQEYRELHIRRPQEIRPTRSAMTPPLQQSMSY